MKKILQKIDGYKVSLLFSFLIPTFIMLAIYVERGIYPFGDRLLLTGDLYHQYLPFFNEFYEKIRNREFFDFSMNLGIGTNFYALYAYYLASPLHWPALLLPQKFLSQYIDYLIVFKTGLCGLSCHYYLSYFQKKNKELPCLFSMFYALSGFMVAYSYNIMWLDCVILLPLIVLGLEKLVKEDKPFLYVVTLGFSIFTNYYLSIMICIFLVIYFVVLLVTEKFTWKALYRFAVYSLLAGGMAGILLIPAALATLASDFGDISNPKNVESYFDLFDVLGRHCVGTMPERSLNHWPNIYCGCAVFALIPVYVTQKKIAMKKRFAYMALAGFFLLSFATNVLSFFWHGLNYPDSLPARQSFIYIFIVIVMCYQGVLHLSKEDTNKILAGVCVGVAFLILWEKFGVKDDIGEFTFALNICLVAFYGALLYCFLTKQGRLKIAVATIGILTAIGECALNSAATGFSTVNRTKYFEKQDDIHALYQSIENDSSGPVRMEKFVRKTKNDGALGQYASATIFSSAINSDVMRFYKKMGMRHSKVYYCYDGATAFVSALMNVDYMLGESEQYESTVYRLLEERNGLYLYESNYKLPFGYVAPKGFDIEDNNEQNSITIQNQLMTQLGLDSPLFIRENTSYDGDAVVFQARHSGIYYGRVTTSGIKKIHVVGTNPETMDFQDLKSGSILSLGYVREGNAIRIEEASEEDSDKQLGVSIYRLDEDVLTTALNILKRNSLENVEVAGNRISGKLELSKEGRLIVSIPVDQCWVTRVNGERVEPQDFGEGLMALDLNPGKYDIEFVYHTRGKAVGILCSVLSVLIVVLLFFLDKKKHSTHEETDNTGK